MDQKVQIRLHIRLSDHREKPRANPSPTGRWLDVTGPFHRRPRRKRHHLYLDPNRGRFLFRPERCWGDLHCISGDPRMTYTERPPKAWRSRGAERGHVRLPSLDSNFPGLSYAVNPGATDGDTTNDRALRHLQFVFHASFHLPAALWTGFAHSEFSLIFPCPIRRTWNPHRRDCRPLLEWRCCAMITGAMPRKKVMR